MTTDIGQGAGGGSLRLGHDPHRDIAVRDNAADLMMLDDNHVANILVPHGTGGLMHRRGAGHRHGIRGHQLTNMLCHELLLLLGLSLFLWARHGPCSRAVVLPVSPPDILPTMGYGGEAGF